MWEREGERERERETWVVKKWIKKNKEWIFKWSGKIIEPLKFSIL